MQFWQWQNVKQKTEGVPLLFLSIFIDHAATTFYKFSAILLVMQNYGLQLSGVAKNSNYFFDYNKSLIFCNSLLAKITKVQLLNIILIGKNCIQILFQHTATLILQPQKLVSFTTS